MLRHAQPLRRRGLTTPPRHSPGKTPSKLRLSTRELPEATIPKLYPRNAGIVPDFKSGENGPPSNFLATSGPRPSLTPCSASQRNHSTTRAAQDPGGASTARTASSAPSPPPDLVVDHRAPHLRPLPSLGEHRWDPPHPLALDIFGRDAPQLPRHPMPASRRRASRGSAMADPPQSTPAFRDPGFGFALTPHTLTDPFHSDSSPAQCERAHAGGRRRAGPPLAVASPVRAPNRLPVATSVLRMPCG